MNKVNYKIQTLSLLILLLSLGYIYNKSKYRDDISQIKQQVEYIYEAESDHLNSYLKNYALVLEDYVNELSKNDSFNENEFKSYAKDFTRHFKDVLAFNFVNSKFIITSIYPEDPNRKALGKDLTKHPDPIVAKTYAPPGPSRKEINFLPPVDIYQGGRAVVFYVPITFKNGTYGWFNIVVLAKNIFKQFNNKSYINIYQFAVLDENSHRFYIGDDKRDYEKSDVLKFRNQLFNRNLTYHFDISDTIKTKQDQYFKDYLYTSIITLLFTIALALYLRNQQRIFNEYTSIKAESNLLKTLVHDLSSPVQMVHMGIDKLIHESGDDGLSDDEFLQRLKQQQNKTVEILSTVRDLYSGKENKRITSFPIAEVVEEVLTQYTEQIAHSHLNIIVDIPETEVVQISIGRKIFKNHVLANILSNAIKFAPHGSELTIRFKDHDLDICNFFDPIPEERLQRLNSITTQESTEDSDHNTSLGLGMFIAKIFCRESQIQFSIKQDSSGLVTSTLNFMS